MNYPELYLDSDEVKRGYYVYSHSCKQTGKIFYVGRGKLDRAWDQEKRSESWKQFVASLPKGYEVTLMHSDLTEEESIAFERTEIEAHGGAASTGGSLVNWIPGDMSSSIGLGVAIVLDVHAGDEEGRKNAEAQEEAYRRVRKFKQLTRAQKLESLAKLDGMIAPHIEPLRAIIERHDERDNYDYPPGVSEACDIVDELDGLAGQLRNQKISYVDFCLEAESALEQFEFCIEDAKGRLKKRISELDIACCKWFELFDTGNQEEARQAEHDEYARQGGPEKMKALFCDNPEHLSKETRDLLGIPPPNDGDAARQ